MSRCIQHLGLLLAPANVYFRDMSYLWGIAVQAWFFGPLHWSARIVLFVGRLEPLKGVDILIGAASMLDSDVDCSVLIVGGDETTSQQVEDLQGLASTLGVGERVAFVGAGGC